MRPGAGNARLEWPKTLLPALENLGELRRAATFGAVDRARILLDDSAPTALEYAYGNWGPTVQRLGSHHASAGATVAALAAAFDKHLAPSCRQPRTRADYCRARRLAVTWAVARQAVHDILHMPPGPAQGADVGHGLLRSPELADRAGVEVLARRGTGSFSSASSSVRPTGTRCGSRRWARFAVGCWL